MDIAHRLKGIEFEWDEEMEEEFELRLHPRETETVSIEIPKDALISLKKVAASRDMSYQALLKLYIGQGLRHDIDQNTEVEVSLADGKLVVKPVGQPAWTLEQLLSGITDENLHPEA